MTLDAMRDRNGNGGLSELDRRLLSLLRQDSRKTYSELAAVLEVSRTTVKDRMERLRDRGILTRFTIEVSPAVAEPARGLLAFFHLQLKRPNCKHVYETIHGWPEIIGCWSIAGNTDMTVLINALSDTELETLRDRLARHPEVKVLWTELCLKQWTHRLSMEPVEA